MYMPRSMLRLSEASDTSPECQPLPLVILSPQSKASLDRIDASSQPTTRSLGSTQGAIPLRSSQDERGFKTVYYATTF